MCYILYNLGGAEKSESSANHHHSAETSSSVQMFCEDWAAPKYTHGLFTPAPGAAKVLDFGGWAAIKEVPSQHRADVQPHKKRFRMCLQITVQI